MESLNAPKPDPRKQAYTRKPDGTYQSVFDILKKEKESGELVINSSLLKPCDIVGMQYVQENLEVGEIAYVITGAEVVDAGLNVGAPRKMPLGRLKGFLESEVLNQDFRLAGSMLGGYFQAGIMANGRMLLFVGDHGNYTTHVISKLGVFRKDYHGNITPVSQEQLYGSLRESMPSHDSRLALVYSLMMSLGFEGDFQDCSQIRVENPIRFENERYIANYVEGMALGNRLAVYDKSNGQWMEFGFYDFNGEQTLKVSFADLKGIDYKEFFFLGYVTDDTSILHSDRPVTTFVTSPTLNLNVINYHPGDQDLEQIGIAEYDPTKYRYRGRPSPNIILFPDGSISINHRGFFTPIEKSHPGALKLIYDAVTLDQTSEGKIQFSFNGHKVGDVVPEDEIRKLLKDLNKNTLLDLAREFVLRLLGRN